MRKIWVTVVLLSCLFLMTLPFQAQARTKIENVLTQGSKWELNVDGEVGTLELFSVKDSGGRWNMTIDINWQNSRGILNAIAGETNQEVMLIVTRKNGLQVTCQGFIALETDGFMAGITASNDGKGAWFATRLSALSSVKELERAQIKPGTKVKSKSKSTPAGAIIKVPSKSYSKVGPKSGSCSISGKATGPQKNAASSSFSISLYGPDNDHHLREARDFDSFGGYKFSGLPDGRYLLVVNVLGKEGSWVKVNPSQKRVVCRGAAIKQQNFNFTE